MESNKGLKEYIATFNAILAEVGWEKDQPGTIRLFKDGLMLWLSRRMHQRDVWPRESELTKWQELARCYDPRHHPPIFLYKSTSCHP
jgi:hypothetical protein